MNPAPVCCRHRRPRALFVLAALMAGMLSPAFAQDPESGEHPGLVKSGNLLQWGIPLFGFGLSFLLNGRDATDETSLQPLAESGAAPGLNWPGPRLGGSARHDFLLAFVRMEVSTYALKYSIDAKRPNGGGQSFPSGHTAAAFMGAEYIRKQFGNDWGVPAYLAGGLVGYSRVESHNHYWRDVIAGAALGIACNYDFDSVDTPVGQLSFGVDAFSPGVASGFDDSEAPGKPLPLIPGLRLQFRFR